jgi:citrate lyase subunit beta / citryl-CoA lyase
MTSPIEFRPRRSCLYMPGVNARALVKAETLMADMLILDLEDAVAPEEKPQARLAVLEAVNRRAFGDREVIIRVNGPDTEWGHDDLKMAISSCPDGILIPKIVTSEQVLDLDRFLSGAGATKDLDLWIMIEMPLAILNIKEIAASAQRSRLKGFVIGTNDLAKELNATPTADRSAFQVPLVLALAAARAYGLVAIDGVYNDIKNEQGLTAECEQGRILGFDGKTLIHPAQLETANRIFSPNPTDVAQAEAVIKAFSQPESKDKGVIKVNGKMVERLHLEQAYRLVTTNKAIQAGY